MAHLLDGREKRGMVCNIIILKTHAYLLADLIAEEVSLTSGETELEPTLNVRIWTFHTLTDMFARIISASLVRSTV